MTVSKASDRHKVPTHVFGGYLQTMKLLTITVPCYNSEAYLERCIRSMAGGGDELDILIVDDGSTDRTGAIADRLAGEYPNIIRVIHQENGGHGEGINQGIRTAQGLYLKTVDSDDRLDAEALKKLLDILRTHTAPEDQLDLVVNDYVYDREDEPCCFSVRYDGEMEPGRDLDWETVRPFPIWKQFMIHSLTYRVQMLRDMGLVLPKHTFYEDNLYIYRPLPYTKRLYYLDQPLYGYFIGREDQSVNDNVIIRRLDQVTRIATDMITSYPMSYLNTLPKHLRSYMLNNLAGQLFTTSSLQYMSGDKGLEMNSDMWCDIHLFDPELYSTLRRHVIGMFTVMPGKAGHALLVQSYKLGRKMIKF